MIRCGDVTPAQAAFAALGEHRACCSTCVTVNEDGRNAHLPCEIADRLGRTYRETRRAAGGRAVG